MLGDFLIQSTNISSQERVIGSLFESIYIKLKNKTVLNGIYGGVDKNFF